MLLGEAQSEQFFELDQPTMPDQLPMSNQLPLSNVLPMPCQLPVSDLLPISDQLLVAEQFCQQKQEGDSFWLSPLAEPFVPTNVAGFDPMPPPPLPMAPHNYNHNLLPTPPRPF